MCRCLIHSLHLVDIILGTSEWDGEGCWCASTDLLDNSELCLDGALRGQGRGREKQLPGVSKTQIFFPKKYLLEQVSQSVLDTAVLWACQKLSSTHKGREFILLNSFILLITSKRRFPFGPVWLNTFVTLAKLLQPQCLL
jgi:hypothetical protein